MTEVGGGRVFVELRETVEIDGRPWLTHECLVVDVGGPTVARVAIYIRQDRRARCRSERCRRVAPMAQPTFDFADQVVVVTGGSRGVGAGIVTAFLDAGANVVTCGRHEAEVDGAVFVAADIRKPAEAELVIAKAVERWGRLDVLVNNAGGSPSVPAAEATPRFVQAIVALNLLAPLWCAQSAHKVMAVQEEGGAIVNVASVSGMRPSPGASVYGAAKAGPDQPDPDAGHGVGARRCG